MYYSYKGEKPSKLPNRIRLSNGLTKTNSSTFNNEDLEDAGYIRVEPQPHYNSRIEKVVWDKEKVCWSVVNLTPSEINEHTNQQWSSVRSERDELIKSTEWLINRYHSEVRLGLEPTDDIAKLDEYIQALRDITKQPVP